VDRQRLCDLAMSSVLMYMEQNIITPQYTSVEAIFKIRMHADEIWKVEDVGKLEVRKRNNWLEWCVHWYPMDEYRISVTC
jgi:hypothetical protein